MQNQILTKLILGLCIVTQKSLKVDNLNFPEMFKLTFSMHDNFKNISTLFELFTYLCV